jgi:hypothetical protein
MRIGQRISVGHAGLSIEMVISLRYPWEIGPLMEEAGFETVDILGCEGVVAANEEQINLLTSNTWQAWVDLNF